MGKTLNLTDQEAQSLVIMLQARAKQIGIYSSHYVTSRKLDLNITKAILLKLGSETDAVIE